MRWAFWRRRPPEPSVHSPSVTPDSRHDAWTGGKDDPPDERRRAAAFSGASPQHVPTARSGGRGFFNDGSTDSLEVDLPAVRSDLVAVAEAVLARDRAQLDVSLQSLEGRGDDHTAVAAFAAMGLLGELCAAAAGVDPEQLEPGTQRALEVLAQGETLARRADQLLRSLAPSCSSGLVRLVVHLSCGSYDTIDEQADPAPRDMLLVAVALLAQTCEDGQLTPAELTARLAEMLVPES